MEADGDIFFKGQPKQVYDALKAPKQFVRFGSEDGAEDHCQSGALAYKNQVIFDWWMKPSSCMTDARANIEIFGTSWQSGLAFDGAIGLDSIY